MDTPSHASSTRRVIKRYSNRKLYDTRESRYVTLQQIGEMVRRGEDVQVIDNTSKEDKTEATLALILSEGLKTEPGSVQVSALRNLLQERGERLLSTLREGPIGRLIPGTAADGGEGTEGDRMSSKSRLTGIVESSRHTLDQLQSALDERVQAVVPALGLIRNLRAEVAALDRRLEAIEKHLGLSAGGSGNNTQ